MLLLRELCRFLKSRKKFWLLPLIFINLALGNLPGLALQPPRLAPRTC